MKTISKIMCAIGVALILSGCESIPDVDQVAEKTIEAAQNLNDRKFDAGLLLICGAPLRVIMENLASNPRKLAALYELCDFSANSAMPALRLPDETGADVDCVKPPFGVAFADPRCN